MNDVRVEACIDCRTSRAVEVSVANAYRGGASTVELCSAMDHGGLTPSVEHVRRAREAFEERPGVMVMVRPRPGDFEHTPAEVDRMHAAVDAAADAGADGVVLGVLSGPRLHAEAMRALVATAHARHLAVTCHRAFDAVAEPASALEELIDMGVARVLTSGTPWGAGGDALAGIDRLAALIRQGDGRIEVVVGGGLRCSNVRRVLSRLPVEAGPVSVHAFSGLLRDGVTDAALVAEMVRLVRRPG